MYLDKLAGRKALEADLQGYNKDLKEWLVSGNNRSTRNALEGVGLTLRRFRGLIRKYEEKDGYGEGLERKVVNENLGKGNVSEVRMLREQWESYFSGPLFDRRLREITNPFPVRTAPTLRTKTTESTSSSIKK